MKVGSHDVVLLKDGEEAFPAMLAAIAKARSTVCLETYILKDDETGRRFGAALSERARAGVEVSLMYDDWGSEVSDAFISELHQAGVRTVAFRPVRLTGPLRLTLTLLRKRNHRKALVIDGVVAFTGGLNISNEYAPTSEGGGGWRDTHVRLEGPSAVHLERLFLSTWKEARGAPVDPVRHARTVEEEGRDVQIVGNQFRRDRRFIRRAYVDAFNRAKHHIDITSAYFVPPAKVLRALVRAARRGCKVRIIVAGTTDVRLALYGARGLYAKLLRAGVHVYEWRQSILHAKTATVDREWSTVGSANLDSLSLRHNLEVNAVFRDAKVAEALRRMFEDDLATCARITPEWLATRSHVERALWWFAYRLRAWL